jgi:hypothetical protein
MAVGNQAADNVTTFRIEERNDDRGDDGRGNDGRGNDDPGEDERERGQGDRGSLRFTGNYIPVGSPSGMVFLI